MIVRAGPVAIMIVVAAAGLYQLKYDVAMLEEETARLTGVLEKERHAIHVLNAEWAHLNHPARLSSLVERHLDLVPVEAAQIIGIDALPRGELSAARPDGAAAETGER